MLRQLNHGAGAFCVDCAVCIRNVIADDVFHVLRLDLVGVVLAAVVFLHQQHTPRFRQNAVANDRIFVAAGVKALHLSRPFVGAKLALERLRPHHGAHLHQQDYLVGNVHYKGAFASRHHPNMAAPCFIGMVLPPRGGGNGVLLKSDIGRVALALHAVLNTNCGQHDALIILNVKRGRLLLRIFLGHDLAQVCAAKCVNGKAASVPRRDLEAVAALDLDVIVSGQRRIVFLNGFPCVCADLCGLPQGRPEIRRRNARPQQPLAGLLQNGTERFGRTTAGGNVAVLIPCLGSHEYPLQ